MLQLPMAQPNLRGQRAPDTPRDREIPERIVKRGEDGRHTRRVVVLLHGRSFQSTRKLTVTRCTARAVASKDVTREEAENKPTRTLSVKEYAEEFLLTNRVKYEHA